jgi:hypothetical protein
MPTDVNFSGPVLNTTRGQQFIPELWVNEIQMFRKSRTFDKSFVKTFFANVVKGDTYHVPRVSELAVEDKATDVRVALQSNNDTDFTISVDSDKVSAVGIDVMLDMLSSYELRKPYMEAMGYALAKDFSGTILALRAAIYSTAAFNVFSSSNGLITGNGAAFSYTAFLTARSILLENDVMDGDNLDNNLVLMISPRQEAAIMGITQFISKDFISNQPVMDGYIGSLLGTPVVRSNLIGANSLTGWRNGASNALEPTPGATGSRYLPKQDAFTALPLTFTGNSAPVHTAILAHKEWAAAVANETPKFTESFENLEQINAIVGRQVYGAKLYRPGHAINIHTSNALV